MDRQAYPKMAVNPTNKTKCYIDIAERNCVAKLTVFRKKKNQIY